MDNKAVKSIKKFKKNDPMYSCDLYLEHGCSHIDSYLCKFPICPINDFYKSNMKRLESFENELLDMSTLDLRYDRVTAEILSIKRRYDLQ